MAWLFGAVFTLCTASDSLATTYWFRAAGGNQLQAAANWSNSAGVAASVITTNDDLILINATTVANPDRLQGALGANSFTVSKTNLSTIGGRNADQTFSLGAGGFTIVSGGLYLGTAANANGTLAININMLAAQTWSNAVSLRVVNNITNNGFDLTIDGAGTTTLGGVTNATTSTVGSISGTGGLIKNGSGTLILAGTNTFTGDTVVNAGTLLLSNALALQSSAYDTASAGSLAATTTGLSFGGLFGSGDLAGKFTSGYSNVTALTLNVGTGLSQTYSGVIANGAAGMTLTKNGAGTQTLSGASTFTGATTVNAGTLAYGGNNALGSGGVTINSNATLDVGSFDDTVGAIILADGNITGTSGLLTGTSFSVTNGSISVNLGGTSAALTKLGTGTVLLSGADSSYGGTTTVGAGVLRVTSVADAGANSSIGTNGTVIITNGGMFDYAGTTNASMNRGVSLASGSGLIGVSNSAAALTISGVISNAGSLVKTNGGTLILSGANTYSGTTTITNGALNIQNSAGLGGTGSGTTVGSGAALELQGGLSIGAEALTLNGTGIGAAGALRNISGDNSYAGVITLGSAARINSDAGTLTINSAGNITGNFGLVFGGAGNIVLGDGFNPATATQTLGKDGTGTLTLSAASTYTGLTTINRGTLAYGINNALSTGAITISNSVALLNEGVATLDIGTFTDSVGAVTLVEGEIVGTTGVLTSTAAFAMQSGAVSANLAGGVGLNKTTAGTVILSGSNAYTGATAISAGVLRAANSNALGTTAGATTISSGAALELSNNISIGAEGLNLAGTGIDATGALRNVHGTNSFAGAITNTAASLIEADADTALALSGSISGNFAKTFDGAGNIAAGGIISGSGGVTKTGAGTLTLSAANTFTGNLTNSGGTVRATSNAGALGGGNVTMSGGALELANNTGLNFADPLSVSSSTTITSDRLTSGDGVTHTLGLLTNGAQTINIVSGANVTGGTAGITFGNVVLTASGATYNAGEGTLLTLGGITGNTFGFTVGGAGNTTIGGVIGTTTGTVSKTGAGTLALGGANTFTGALTVEQGTLSVATINNAGANGTLGNSANAVTLGSSGNSGELLYTGATAGSTKAFNLAAGGTGVFNVSNSATALTLGGAISNSGSLVKAGEGTLVFTNAKTYTGDTVVAAGTLMLSNTGSIAADSRLVVSNGATFDMNNIAETVDGASGVGTVDLGSAALTISNAATEDFAGSIVGTGALIKVGAGSQTLSGSNSYTGSTTIAGGTLAISADNNLGTAPGTATAGRLTFSNGATLAVTTGFALNANRGIALGTGGGVIDVASGQNLSYAGTIAGAGEMEKIGAGTFTLSSSNSYTGMNTIAGGTLRVENSRALGSLNAGDAITLSGGSLQLAADASTTFGANTGYGTIISSNTTITSDRLSAGAGVAQQLGALSMGAQTLTVNAGANVTSGTAALVFGGATTLTGNATFATATNTELRFDNTLSGAVNITKTGDGILTLNRGGGQVDTTITAGQLNINHFQALGTPAGTLTLAGGVTLDNTATNSVTVGNAKSISLGSTLTFLGTTNLNLGSGVTTLTNNTAIDVVANTFTLGGDVVGAFGLTKNGAGTLELSGLTGTNSFTGNSFVNAGELFLNGTSRFGGTSNTVVTVETNAFLRVGASASLGNVSLVLNNPEGLILAGVITNDVTISNSGTISTNYANIDGTITIGEGVTASSSANNFGTIPTTNTPGRIVMDNNSTLAATATFTINQSQGILLQPGVATFSPGTNVQVFIASSITGDGELRKIGAGNIRLTGSNSYTGGTVIDQGIIGITSDSSLGAVSGSVKLNNGTLVAAQNNTGGPTNSGTTVNALRTIVLGNGTTNNIDAQSGLFFEYNGVIGEEDGGGAASNMRFGIAGTREGTVKLGGLNTYDGATTIVAGTLEISNIANGGQASGIGQSGNAAGNLVIGGTLRYAGTNASTDRLFSLGSSGAGTIDSGSGTLAFTNTGAIGYAATNLTRHDLTLTGTGSGTLAVALVNDVHDDPLHIVKNGNGTWILSGTNDYTGTTTINGGTLQISSDANLGRVAGSEGLVFSNGGILKTTGSLTNSRVVAMTGAGTVNTDGNVVEFSGAMSGNGALTKTGTGTLALSGVNAFAGGTTLSAGVLRADTTTALGSGSLAQTDGTSTLQINAGGTIANNMSVYRVSFVNSGNTLSGTITNQNTVYDVPAGTTNTLSGFITGAGGLELVGGGVLEVTGTTNDYAGATSITNGTLRVTTLANAGSVSSIGTNASIVLAGSNAASAVFDYTGGNVTIDRSLVLTNGGGTIVMASSNTAMTMTGSASGSGDLVIAEGKLVLSNTSVSNSFAPASIQVDSGATLELGANNQIGNSTGLILNGGTFIVGNSSAGYSDTLGTLTLNASSTIDLGSYSTGLRTLSFANSSAITWTGTLTITNWQGMTRAPSDVAQILFGTGGLTTTQLGQIYFANQDINGGVLVGGNGELVPIPEAEVYWGALAIALAVGYRERRRLVSILRQVRR